MESAQYSKTTFLIYKEKKLKFLRNLELKNVNSSEVCKTRTHTDNARKISFPISLSFYRPKMKRIETANVIVSLALMCIKRNGTQWKYNTIRLPSGYRRSNKCYNLIII